MHAAVLYMQLQVQAYLLPLLLSGTPSYWPAHTLVCIDEQGAAARDHGVFFAFGKARKRCTC